MIAVGGFIQNRPVLAYYLLTFTISWTLFVLLGGSDFIDAGDWEDNSAFLLAVMGMLAGPTIASLLLTWRLSGRAGLRELGSRLITWRVNAGWYAVALLTAPFTVLSVLFTLSLGSSDFLPPILSEGVEGAALAAALGAGFTTLLEELGWTGFATPRLRFRYGAFRTALIVGVLWAAWHLLQITWVGRVSHAEVPLAVYLTLYFFSSVASLTAYRVLMVWVYDCTDSLLLATLMHASYAICTLPFLLPSLTGWNFVLFFFAFDVFLWALVGGMALRTGEELFKKPVANPPLAREVVSESFELRERSHSLDWPRHIRGGQEVRDRPEEKSRF